MTRGMTGWSDATSGPLTIRYRLIRTVRRLHLRQLLARSSRPTARGCPSTRAPAARGRRRSSRLARVTCISPGQRLDWKNSGEPQRPQKLRVAAGEELEAAAAPRPRTRARSGLAAVPTQVTKAAPCARRHIEQWQCATQSGGQADAVAHRAAEAAARPQRSPAAGETPDERCARVAHTTRTFLNCQGSVCVEVLGEQPAALDQRVPVGVLADDEAEVRAADLEDALVVDFVGLDDAAVRVLHRPDQAGQRRHRHLQRGRVVVRRRAAALPAMESCEPYQ